MPTSRSAFKLFFALAFSIAGLLGSGCSTESENSGEPSGSQELTVYSGRGKSLVEPLIVKFQEETGITVNVRYGDTAPLALSLIEEGDLSPADIYWAQDAGALGAVQDAGLFTVLPEELMNRISVGLKSPSGHWAGTSGRARVLAFSPSRLNPGDLPDQILDLADVRYKDRIGWAPTNGSFQAAVSGMRHILGETKTRKWLNDMQANGVKSYGNNRGIIEAIANNEIDLGIPNHYYLYRYKKDDPDYPVDQKFFAPGDPGNMVNVAGVGILKTSSNESAAIRFVDFLLSADSQAYFANTTYEYPVVAGIEPSTELEELDRLDDLRPSFDLGEIKDLSVTLELLRDTEIL